MILLWLNRKQKDKIPPDLFDNLDNAIKDLKRAVKISKAHKNKEYMKPQTITYGNGDEVVRLDDTNTFLVHVDNLELGSLFTPAILVNGIEDDTVKFDFY